MEGKRNHLRLFVLFVFVFMMVALTVGCNQAKETKPSEQSNQVQEQSSKQNLKQDRIVGRSVVVMQFEGDVKLFREGNAEGLLVYEGLHLVEGDKLETASGAYVLLNIDNNKVAKLDGNTQIQLTTVTGDTEKSQTEIYLVAGKITSSVAKLKDGASYLVKTNNSTMGVRGTVFIVEVVENKVVVNLLSGSVALSATDTKTGETIQRLINDMESGLISDGKIDIEALESISVQDAKTLVQILETLNMIEEQNQSQTNSGNNVTASQTQISPEFLQEIEQIKGEVTAALNQDGYTVQKNEETSRLELLVNGAPVDNLQAPSVNTGVSSVADVNNTKNNLEGSVAKQNNQQIGQTPSSGNRGEGGNSDPDSNVPKVPDIPEVPDQDPMIKDEDEEEKDPDPDDQDPIIKDEDEDEDEDNLYPDPPTPAPIPIDSVVLENAKQTLGSILGELNLAIEEADRLGLKVEDYDTLLINASLALDGTDLGPVQKATSDIEAKKQALKTEIIKEKARIRLEEAKEELEETINDIEAGVNSIDIAVAEGLLNGLLGLTTADEMNEKAAELEAENNRLELLLELVEAKEELNEAVIEFDELIVKGISQGIITSTHSYGNLKSEAENLVLIGMDIQEVKAKTKDVNDSKGELDKLIEVSGDLKFETKELIDLIQLVDGYWPADKIINKIAAEAAVQNANNYMNNVQADNYDVNEMIKLLDTVVAAEKAIIAMFPITEGGGSPQPIPTN